MEEYETLEPELQELFKMHFQQYRNVDHFEHELALQGERRKVLLAEAERNLEKMRRKVRKNFMNGVKGSVGASASNLPDEFGFPQVQATEPVDSDDDSF
jgi:hypothetical protein